MKILINKRNILSNNRSSGHKKYIRPSEYLDLPTLVDGDNKVVLLVKVTEKGGNYIRLQATSDYTVDWGDGQPSVNYTSNDFADYSIDYNNISPSTETEYGYRQAIVTLTPQAGFDLTYFKLGNLIHPDDRISTTGNINVVDVKMAGSSITSLFSSFYNTYGLEQFEFVGTCNVTTLSQAFYICYNLRRVVAIDTSNVTDFYRCFRQCQLLLEVPKFNFIKATNVKELYYNNSKIEYIEPYDLDNEAPLINNIKAMFFGCGSLAICPILSCFNIQIFTSCFSSNRWGGDFNLDCSNATAVNQMFSTCVNIEKVNAIFPNNLTNTTYMFDQCSSLTEIRTFDCSNVTDTQFMFRNTFKLRDLSGFDFSATNNMNYMFINSGIQKSPSQLGGGSMTYFSQGVSFVRKWGNFNGTPTTSLTRSFLGNLSLEEVPNIVINSITTTFSSTFDSMRNLTKIPSWDCSTITNAGNWFGSAYRLSEVNAYNMTVTHTYINCNLMRDEIVNVFTNLGTAVASAVITVTGNPGCDLLTTTDLLIAQNKGWTVVY